MKENTRNSMNAVSNINNKAVFKLYCKDCWKYVK